MKSHFPDSESDAHTKNVGSFIIPSDFADIKLAVKEALDSDAIRIPRISVDFILFLFFG